MTHIEIKEDSKAYVIDGMPEEKPILDMSGAEAFPQIVYEAEMEEYREVLASAPRILVSDQEQARQLINKYCFPYSGHLLPPAINTIYQVPVEWERKGVCCSPLPPNINHHGYCNECSGYSEVAILKKSPKKESDPLDKFMDDEIAYLKSCNPVNRFGEMENMFAAGMIHAYERLKDERDRFNSQKP